MDEGYLRLIRMSGRRYRQIEINCEICNRHNFELIIDKGRIGRTGQYGYISIVQCCHCGHVMLNPRYEPQFYIDYYRYVYKDIGNFGGEKPRPGFLERQIERGEAVRKFLTTRYNFNGNSMLDLGCSFGATMIPFRNNGWDVHGIDPEKASVEYGEQKLDLPVVYGCAESLPYADKSIDLVLSLGTLEHVYDFHATMNELSRVLKKGGYLFIRMRHNRPWGLIWEYYNANHYRFFCEATQRLAVLRYGFEVLEYSEQEIEGIPGHKYLVCHNLYEPSLECVEQAIHKGLKDPPGELKHYLIEHHREFIVRAKGLIDLVKQYNGNLYKVAAEIAEGRFKYTLLDGERLEAVKRALFEAERVLKEEGAINYE